MMNDKDYQMFHFLSTISFEEFEQWMDQASVDDIDYAINLYKMVRQNTTEQVQTIAEEIECAIEEDLFNMAGDFQEAKNVITRVMAKK
jgi:hypothetical protein